MRTIPQITKDIISRRPFLLSMIPAGLINLTALARSIKNEIEEITLEEVKLGSIVMALKRYAVEITPPIIELEGSINQINNIMVISNLVEFTFSGNTNDGTRQEQLSSLNKYDGLSFLSYIKGMHEVTIISDSKYEKDIEKIYAKNHLISKMNNMSGIILQLPANNEDMPGLYYYIFQQLAWEGIPISEVVSTQNELMLLVKEDYIEEAFLLIKKLQSKK